MYTVYILYITSFGKSLNSGTYYSTFCLKRFFMCSICTILYTTYGKMPNAAPTFKVQ